MTADRLEHPPPSPHRHPLVSTPEHARGLQRDLLLIRRFEERCAELYQATKVRGFLHLYIGEEAIAVGAMQALGPGDAVVATYREHGHALARGLDPGAVMAEMYGEVEGCSGGRGGSMHLFDVSRGFYGGNAIVAGGLPLAVGIGLAARMRGRPDVAGCFFGEGAVAEGEFHESLNLAALWQLPVLFKLVVQIAPDLDPADITDSDDLQHDLGLDSMDSLSLAVAVKERTGVEIPDRDLPKVRTVGQLVAYLAERTPA